MSCLKKDYAENFEVQNRNRSRFANFSAHFSALISTKTVKNAKDVYKIYFELKVNLLGEAKFEAVYIVDVCYYKKIKSLEEFDELQQ